LVFTLQLLAADGDVDPSFKSPLTANHLVWCVAEQPDGKLLVGGEEMRPDGATRAFLLRLRPDGRLDRSFRVRWRKSEAERVVRVRIREDGNITMVGNMPPLNRVTAYDGSGGYGNVAVLNKRGRPVRTYSPQRGIGNPWNAPIAPDGTVYFETSYPIMMGAIGSLNPSGQTNSLRPLGKWCNAAFLRVLDDGRVAGGYVEGGGGYRTYLIGTSYVRVLSGGIIDVQLGPTNTVYYAGSLQLGDYRAVWRSGMIRTTSAGKVDPSFNFSFPVIGTNSIATSLPRWSVQAFARDPLERITFVAVCGYLDEPRQYFVGRVLADGSPDTSFTMSNGPEGTLTGLLRTRGGDIVVWGQFGSFNGVASPGVVRLQSE
jgi:hypothetical protein